MNTKELIETLKLQATFVNAGGYINQGNVMKEAAERLEEFGKTITENDVPKDVQDRFLKTPYNSQRKTVFLAAVNSWLKHKRES